MHFKAIDIDSTDLIPPNCSIRVHISICSNGLWNAYLLVLCSQTTYCKIATKIIPCIVPKIIHNQYNPPKLALRLLSDNYIFDGA